MVWRKKSSRFTDVCLGSLMGLLAMVSACAEQTPAPVDAAQPDNGVVTLTSASDVSEDDIVRFGVLSIDSATSVNERYSPLLAYLSERVGTSFELFPVSQQQQFAAVEAGELDFITSNPLASVQIKRLHNTDFLVTHTRPGTGPNFSGLIIVRQDSPIQTLEDLQDKAVACVAFQTAAAGCTFQIFHLLQNGIDPFTDFSSFVENKSQDNIVLAVLNGTIDAGFIRTGQLEKMVGKELINDMDEVRILDVKTNDFPFPHTTELYPEWPIAAIEGTDPELISAVKAALLDIPADHQALSTLKADGFIPAVDYSKLDNLIQTLQLKSWDVEPNSP